jgi:hypothetical protein
MQQIGVVPALGALQAPTGYGCNNYSEVPRDDILGASCSDYGCELVRVRER